MRPFPLPSTTSSKDGPLVFIVCSCTSACNMFFFVSGMTRVSNGKLVHWISSIQETANSAGFRWSR